MSVRKRKIMLKKFNTFFEAQGRILTELEYSNAPGTPYRKILIKKFFGGYTRMVNYLNRYYPHWRHLKEEQALAAVRAVEMAQTAAALRSQAETAQE